MAFFSIAKSRIGMRTKDRQFVTLLIPFQAHADQLGDSRRILLLFPALKKVLIAILSEDLVVRLLFASLRLAFYYLIPLLVKSSSRPDCPRQGMLVVCNIISI